MSRTCLIAEHDPWNLQLLRLHAERLGFEVVQVYEARDVLPVAREARPDVVILEARLPGRAACKDILSNLYADPATRDIAVVLLSDVGDCPADQDSPGGKASSLQEPVTFEALRSALEQAGVMSELG